MALRVEAVDGPAFAGRACAILNEAWPPPALYYTPEYLKWQLEFPSPVRLPAVAAFDEDEPVGFAAATARRLQLAGRAFDSAIVSFVAVRPAWQGRGIAARLYDALLSRWPAMLRPFVTFAHAGSGGERALLRAYPQAGIPIDSVGVCSNFAYLKRGRADVEWQAEPAAEPEPVLAGVTADCASLQPEVLWSAPASEGLRHYQCDPRPRQLIVLRHASGLLRAAWLVQAQLRVVGGIQTSTFLDSVWLTKGDDAALLALLEFASALWPAEAGAPTVISAPNLSMFDPARLRALGIRQTGAVFHAYACGLSPEQRPSVTGTNLEVI